MAISLTTYADQFRNLNPRDVGTWPAVPRAATALGIIVVVIALGYFFYWSDLLDTLHTAQESELAVPHDREG